MNKKIIWLIFCVISLIGSTFTIASSEKIKLQLMDKTMVGEVKGNTLIVEKINNRVLELNTLASIVWQKTGLNSPNDAERLDNGNTLISEYASFQVIEIDSAGNIVWQQTGIDGPQDVERLDNGNTLITEASGFRVIEIDNFGNIIWQFSGLNWPTDAERLDNGHTLIAESQGQRVIEVDNSGSIIWEKDNLSNPVDVERLNNGNTIITELNLGRVIEVDNWGAIIREIKGLNSPFDAERLPNGDILIAEYANNRIIQINPNDEIVWEVTGLEGAVDVERLPNLPPTAPEITGPNVGKMFTPLYFNFTSVDPNADTISYFVNWGDTTDNAWSLPQNSGEPYCENHTWYIPVNYTIIAKVVDCYGAESDWTALEIIIPRNKIFVNWIMRFFDRFPILNQLINNLFATNT